jgi:heme exporter protein C
MTFGTRLRLTSAAAALVLLLAFGLAFFSARIEADQGFSQKIFYVHVPLAIVALGGFVYGAVMAVQHLRTRDARYDLRSYVAIHLAVVLGVGALLTGAIWAKAAWGVWFEWREPTLVSFLIVFLLYCTYQPLRFSIEDPEKQARYASVFAITAGAFVPLNFLAVRLADPYIHPRVLNQGGGDLPDSFRLPFYLGILGMTLLFAALYQYELSNKNARMQIRQLKRKLGGEVEAPTRSAAPQVPAP